MNNQVKLIDESKMLEWIDTMYNKKLPDELKEYRNGRQVVLDLLEIQIKSGCFAPDTPPVPTIKPGDKVRHDDWGDGVVYDLDEDDAAIAIVDFDDEGLMSIHCDELEVVE